MPIIRSLSTAAAVSGLPRNVVVAVVTLLPLLPPRPYGKPEAAAAVDRLLMRGMRMSETC
jgi:hypothetical protein